MREQPGYRTREANPSSRASSRQTLLLRVVGSERAVNLDRDCTVGTARDNTLVLSDPYVSRRHCVVVRRDDSLWLQDEGQFIDACHERPPVPRTPSF